MNTEVNTSTFLYRGLANQREVRQLRQLRQLRQAIEGTDALPIFEPLSAWEPLVWLALLLREYGPASDHAIFRAAESTGISRRDVRIAAIRLGVLETWDLSARFTRPQWSLPRLSDYRAPFKRERHPDLRFQPAP